MNGKKQGLFVVIEGIDGCGTTTQSRLLAEWLQARGVDCRLTAEPTDGPVGRLIRQILRGETHTHDPQGHPLALHNDVLSMLFAADRLDHLHSLVIPCLEQGIWVVSDRYYHSSLNYQSLEGDWQWIRELNRRARQPDITYVLDCPVEISWQRLASRTSERELYEKRHLQRRLAEMYRQLPQKLPQETIVLINGVPPAEDVHREIREDLLRRFEF